MLFIYTDYFAALLKRQMFHGHLDIVRVWKVFGQFFFNRFTFNLTDVWIQILSRQQGFDSYVSMHAN